MVIGHRNVAWSCKNYLYVGFADVIRLPCFASCRGSSIHRYVMGFSSAESSDRLHGSPKINWNSRIDWLDSVFD